jgi:serine/threonine protein phosphatase PrpC
MGFCEGMPPVYEAELGWAFGCSCRGASHVRAGKPCQDAYAVWSGATAAAPSLIAAVADGHGDRQHDLSEIGAALATRVAVQELLQQVPGAALYDSLESVERAFSESFPTQVTRRWVEAVQEDAGSRLGAVDVSGEEAILRRYGTTLLTARVSPRLLMLGKIGDGDVLMVRPDGRIESPLGGESDLVGLSTHSLSSRQAVLRWKTGVVPRGMGGILLLATDGLSDSFGGSEHTEFQRFLGSVQDRIQEFGIGEVARFIPQWLTMYSERGSGDDITLVLIAVTPSKEEEEDDSRDRSED